MPPPQTSWPSPCRCGSRGGGLVIRLSAAIGFRASAWGQRACGRPHRAPPVVAPVLPDRVPTLITPAQEVEVGTSSVAMDAARNLLYKTMLVGRGGGEMKVATALATLC